MKVKSGVRLVSAVAANSRWALAADVKPRAATVTATRLDQPLASVDPTEISTSPIDMSIILNKEHPYRWPLTSYTTERASGIRSISVFSPQCHEEFVFSEFGEWVNKQKQNTTFSYFLPISVDFAYRTR
ncbi:hypothetical protein EVAR_37213_1 [Eumeta japonica]|uniref:Uncharacterized protein n=1 Tax=Eumeta variegata TaxID=151549 RepID=A0A4C1Y946_EUMVA|nr:hypothetical protein EVAR_37213_1 [Eumeta japonica]